MHIETQSYDGVILLKPLQDKLDYRNAERFKKQLLNLVKKGYNTIFINLGQLNLIDSSGIGTFISCWKMLGTDVKLNFYALQPHIKKAFISAHLNEVFDIYESEEDVISSIKSRIK